MHAHRHDRYGQWQWLPDRLGRGWYVLELPDYTVKLIGRAKGSYWPRYDGPFWVFLQVRGGAEVNLPENRQCFMGAERAMGAAGDIARRRVAYNMDKIWAATVGRPTEEEEERQE